MKNFFFGLVVGIALVVAGFFALNNYIYQEKQANDADATSADAITGDKHPLLSELQEQALEKFGIKPENLPTSITPTQEECFIGKLGQARVDEIVAGDTPTALEVFNTAGCLGQ